MKLIDDFFSITGQQCDASGMVYDIELNAGHKIYRCHFPGAPITPGVCILQIVSELAENALGKKLQVKGYSNVKYLNVISPIEDPRVSVALSIEEKEGTIRIKAILRSPEKTFTKISAIYE